METGSSNLFELHIDGHSQSYLSEATRWAKFLAIFGFICCALIGIAGIFAGALFNSMRPAYGTGMSSAMGVVVGVLYVLLAILYFFPCLYLYRFSTEMRVAIRSNDQQRLASAFKNLKSWFKFLGILTIVMLCVWFLALIFGGLGAAMSGFR